MMETTPKLRVVVDRLTQHMRTVRSQERRDLRAVQHGIKAGGGVRLGADGVDAGIGTAARGQLLDAFIDIVLHEIDRDRACVRGHLQPLGHRIDGDHPLRAQQEGAADGELGDRTAAEYGDGLAAFDVAEFRAHVAGRENVRQEQDLFVTQPCGNLDRADIRVGDTKIFGLAAGKAAQKMRVAEQASR